MPPVDPRPVGRLRPAHGVGPRRAPDVRGLLRRTATPALVLLAVGVAAVPARAEVLRLTTLPAPGDGAGDVLVTSIAGFSAVSSAAVTAGPGAAIPGLHGAVTALAPSPTGGDAAFVAYGRDSPGPVGLLPLAGGAVRPFVGPDGRRVRSGAGNQELRFPWVSWSPNGRTVTLHRTDRSTVGPSFGRPHARRCDAATARCGAALREDAVALPAGGTVRIRSVLAASADGPVQVVASSSEEEAATRRLRRTARRPAGVRIRVTGRAGVTSTWTATGRPGVGGAPAYDRAFPSAAGVLVRTATVYAPSGAGSGAELDLGRTVVVDAAGRIRSLGRLPHDVVGTLPDGRWLLAGGGQDHDPVEDGEEPRPAAGEPLSTLDTAGRITPLRSGGRIITPIWTAHAAGLPDSVATEAKVQSAGIDTTSGLLVVVLTSDGDDAVVALPLDGSAPPRLLPGPALPDGTGAATTWFVR